MAKVSKKAPPIPHAAGYVIGRDRQVVTVKFSDIQANPESVRGQTRTFKVDINKEKFIPNTWVVASWGSSLRTDAAGNILLQGTVGGGANLRPLEQANHDGKLSGWLPQVRQHLQDLDNRKLQIERGKPQPLPSAQVLSVLSSSTSGDVLGPAPPSWLGVAVPLPVMKEEWAFNQSYLRIGYVSFTLDSPVEDIQIQEITPNSSVATLRSRTPIQKDNWHAQQQITISFTCHGANAQNRILLPLIKMARKAPFVPVFNTLLFEHDITAISLQDIQVQTIPGFPNSVKVVLSAMSFNWQAFLPTATEFSGYDWQICYPLLKMWVEKPCKEALNFHIPMGDRWDGLFRLLHPAESWLKAANEFGQLAEKAQRTNNDVDMFTQAINWRDAKVTSNFEGFLAKPGTQTNGSPILQLPQDVSAGRVGSFFYTEQVKDTFTNIIPISTFQRFTSAFFLRPKTELAALQLCRDPNVVKVYIGAPRLERMSNVEGTSNNLTTFVPSNSASFDPEQPKKGTVTYQVVAQDLNKEIDKEDLAQQIGSNLSSTMEFLKAGNYTFVISADSRSYDNLAAFSKVPPPQISNTPQADLVDTMQPPSLVVEQISCQFQNTIAQLQPRGLRTPTHHYMGSNATVYTVVGTIKNQFDVGLVEDFMQTVNRLGREFRGTAGGRPFGGFVFVDNEFFNFMGTRTALPLSFSTQTIPDFPGALKFEMQLIEFDSTQRRREILDDLYKDLDTLPIGVEEGFERGEASDLRIFSQQDNLDIRYVRQKDFHARLRKVEVYPDLCLPLHSEIRQWILDIQNGAVWDFDTQSAALDQYDFLNFENGGTGWDWGTVDAILDGDGNVIGDALPTSFLQLEPPKSHPDRFADPDFWIEPTQDSGDTFIENVIAASKKQEILVSDPYGTTAKISPGNRIIESSIISDPQRSIDTAKSTTQAGNHPKPVGSNPNGLDKFLNQQQTGVAADATINNGKTASNAISIPDAAGTDRPPAVPVVDDRPNMNDRIKVYGPPASIAAKKYNIPADLLFAHLEVESHWRAKAVSRTGARGLGQIEPSTGVGLGVRNPSDLFDPVTNVFATAKYIAQLRKIFSNHPNGERLAIAAYNAGPGAIKKAGYRVPENGETPAYVLKVIQARSHYKTTGVDSALGSTVGLNTATDQEARQIFGQFQQGYAYLLSELWPHMILGGNTRSANSQQVFQTQWFRKIQVTGAEAGDVFMVVKAAFLPQFIEATRKYKVFPRLVKVKQRLAGKSTYDHTAGQVEANKETIAASMGGLNVLNPLNLEQNIAAEAAKRGVLSGGGSELDAQQAQADAIRKGVTPADIVRAIGDVGTVLGAGSDTQTAANLITEKEAAADKEAGPTYTPPTIQQVFHDPGTGHDVWQDMRQEIQIGRLISAFPTFYIAVIDGGRSLRVWRLFDHVYGMFSVTKIAVHRTRKSPIETAVVGFSNMYGHLTAQSYEMERIRKDDTSTRGVGVWSMDARYRGVVNTIRADFDAETIAMWARHINSLMLKPGARLHIRMGYGADASQLPPVFNGVISEVPIQEGEVEVVALSDGVELMNDVPPTDLQGSMPVTRITSVLGEGLNPRELIMSFMAPVGPFDAVSNFVGQHVPALNGLFYFNFRNAYGIEHYGSPYRQGLRFDDGEVGINIYDPEHSSPFTHTSAADSVFRIFQPWKWGGTRKLLGINMSNATPWDIFETVRRTVPDYILYTHPFELRSTLFMGKGWFPIFTKYREDLDDSALQSGIGVARENFFDWKPFQQVHLITSDWNLIGNSVVADATDVVTKCQAVGTYNGWLPGSNDMSIESSFVMMVDEDIFDEFQKMKVVESGLYSTFNMKLTESNADTGGEARVIIGSVLLLGGVLAAPFTGGLSLATVLTGAGLGGALVLGGGGSLLEGPFRSFLFSRRIMDFYAASVLKDHVKDMYKGPLVCLGSPYFKPYDYIAVSDHLSGLNGLAEIKECVHTMSLETGYVTSVVPDCCCTTYMDTDGHDLMGWVQMTAGHLITAVATSVLIGGLARKASPYSALRSVQRYRAFLADAIRNSKNGVVFGKSLADAKLALSATDTALVKIGNGIKMADKIKVKQALEELHAIPVVKLFDENTPIFIKSEMALQRALSSIPSSKVGTTVNNLVGSGKKYITDLTASNVTEVAAREAKLTQAKQALNGFGKTENELKAARAAIRGGKAATLEAGLAAAIQEFDSAAGAVARSKALGTALTKIPQGEELIRNFVKTSLSRSAILNVGTQVFSILIGGLSDYIVRWAAARQCLVIYPLKVYEKILEAGINGHRGAVAGDDPGIVDNFMDNIIDTFKAAGWVGNLLPIVSDLIQANQTYRHPDVIPPFFRQ